MDIIMLMKIILHTVLVKALISETILNQSLTKMDFTVPTYLLKQYKKLLRSMTVTKDLSLFMLLINLCMDH